MFFIQSTPFKIYSDLLQKNQWSTDRFNYLLVDYIIYLLSIFKNVYINYNHFVLVFFTKYIKKTKDIVDITAITLNEINKP